VTYALASEGRLGHFIGRVSALREIVIKKPQVFVWLSFTVLACAIFACSDLLTTPGVGGVTLVYGGQTQVVVGSSTTVPVAATANGGPVAGARFVLTSSDTTVLAVRGDTLVARRLGSATVTASLASSLVGGTPPSISQAVAVVPFAIVTDSSSVTFHSIGDTVTVVATVLDADSQPVPGAPVQWTSADTTKVTVTPAGRLQARSVGTVAVVAALGSKADTVSVTVTQVLAHYTFVAPVVTFSALTAVQTVTATPRDARGNVIAAGASPTYVVDDATIASVNAATGAVTSAFNGATYLAALRVVGAVTVRDSVQVVVAQKAKAITISPNPVPPITFVGDTRQLTAAAADSASVPMQTASPVWTSGNPSVLQVTQTGLATSVSTGSAFIIAIQDGKRDSVSITVTNDPAAIVIRPDTAVSQSLGDTLVYAARVNNLHGDSLGVIPTWRTPDTALVTVLGSGLVLVRKRGTARIIASAGSKADTVTAVIRNLPAVDTFAVHARTLTAFGDADTPTVFVLNARGAGLDRSTVPWTSDDPAIARVNALGIVTAVDSGTTVIRTGAPPSPSGDSIVYTVQNVPTSVSILLPTRGSSGASSKRDTLTAVGQTLVLGLDVRNHRNVPIANPAVVWSSTVPAVDTVSGDTVIALGFGTSQIVATVGTVTDVLTLVVKHLTRIIVDNSVVANPRVGSLSRPFFHIQDAVNAAQPNDTVQVRRGSGPYSETVALNKRLFLFGDSSSFVSNGRNPANLPLIAHDTGAAAITAFTSAPQTIKYLAVRHTLDGPALADSGSDVVIDNLYVNPSGSTMTRIGRGISIKNSLSGTRITNSAVDSVRGYGVRLEAVSNALVHGVVVVGVDSLPGLEEGAGIKLVSGNTISASLNFVRNAQIGVLVIGATAARVDSNAVWRNLNGFRIPGGTTTSVSFNDIFDNTTDTIPIGLVNPVGTALTVNNNWWGDSRGPRQGSSLATGDSVGGTVTVGTLRASPFSPSLFGGSAAGLRLVRGDNQTGVHGTALPKAFTVRVTDAGGLPVSNVQVQFKVTGGGGSLSSSGGNSSTSGLVESTLTLGTAPATNTVTATVTVSGNVIGTVTFTAMGT
jgi:hypothetical protein